MLSRRGFLAAAGGATALAVVGMGAGQPSVRRFVVDLVDPEPTAPAPQVAAGPHASGVLRSTARGRDVNWRVAYPPGGRPGDAIPVALVLHGRGGNERSAFDDLQLDRYLADVVADGVAPFALAAIDGGDHGYWHPRADGDDPGRMLLDEFVPLLATHGLLTSTVGVFGWSMGGYGGLLLAETAGPARIAAVAADSPALWSSFAGSAEGAFDGAADFAAHDVMAHPERLAGIPVRIACGDRDPFYGAVRTFARDVPDLTGTDFSTGEHTDTFWRRTAPGQLRFLGGVLAQDLA